MDISDGDNGSTCLAGFVGSRSSGSRDGGSAEVDRGRDGPASDEVGLGDNGEMGDGGVKGFKAGFEPDSHKL